MQFLCEGLQSIYYYLATSLISLVSNRIDTKYCSRKYQTLFILNDEDSSANSSVINFFKNNCKRMYFKKLDEKTAFTIYIFISSILGVLNVSSETLVFSRIFEE